MQRSQELWVGSGPCRGGQVLPWPCGDPTRHPVTPRAEHPALAPSADPKAPTAMLAAAKAAAGERHVLP